MKMLVFTANVNFLIKMAENMEEDPDMPKFWEGPVLQISGGTGIIYG